MNTSTQQAGQEIVITLDGEQNNSAAPVPLVDGPLPSLAGLFDEEVVRQGNVPNQPADTNEQNELAAAEKVLDQVDAVDLTVLGNRFKVSSMKKKPTVAKLLVPARVMSQAKELIPEARRVDDEKVDGVDFINIGGAATTDLGKILNINARLPWSSETLGEFASLGGCKYWLQTGRIHNEFRSTFDNKSKQLYNRIVGPQHDTRHNSGIQIPDMHVALGDQMWFQLACNPEVAQAIRESDAPFVEFYIPESHAAKETSGMEWWHCGILEACRDCLKRQVVENNYELWPDFIYFTDVEIRRRRDQKFAAERKNSGNGGWKKSADRDVSPRNAGPGNREGGYREGGFRGRNSGY